MKGSQPRRISNTRLNGTHSLVPRVLFSNVRDVLFASLFYTIHVALFWLVPNIYFSIDELIFSQPGFVFRWIQICHLYAVHNFRSRFPWCLSWKLIPVSPSPMAWVSCTTAAVYSTFQVLWSDEMPRFLLFLTSVDESTENIFRDFTVFV